jgi:hypothetical protein
MKEDWVLGSAKRNREHDVPKRNLIQIIPTSANKYDPLHNLKDDDELMDLGKKEPRVSNTMKDTLKQERPKCAESKWKHKNKVLIIGDSHVKKIAAELRTNFDHSYETTGFTKPGAQMGES